MDFIDRISEELSSIGQKLIPNFFSFIVQLIALIIMILAVMFFAYKPVKKMLNARSEAVESEIREAKENNLISEQNKKMSADEIIEARKKANEIISNAAGIGESQKALIIKKAEEDAIRIKNEAEEEIQKAKEEAKQDIRNEIINVALEASKQILQREISNEDNSRLVEEFIKEID